MRRKIFGQSWRDAFLLCSLKKALHSSIDLRVVTTALFFATGSTESTREKISPSRKQSKCFASNKYSPPCICSVYLSPTRGPSIRHNSSHKLAAHLAATAGSLSMTRISMQNLLPELLLAGETRGFMSPTWMGHSVPLCPASQSPIFDTTSSSTSPP